MYLLGLDIGTSSIKASVIHAGTGECTGSAQSPSTEMKIIAPQPGWAEQDPETWWQHTQQAIAEVLKETGLDSSQIKAIGSSYQMHGLVCVDKQMKVLRNAIIWCDSRAVETGNNAFTDLGVEKCLSCLLYTSRCV